MALYFGSEQVSVKSVVNGLASNKNYPMLSERLNWYPNGYGRETVTEVRFVSDYKPKNFDSSWDAGLESGTITGYREGNVVTVSANGKQKIKMNSNSEEMFAQYSNLKAVHGLDMLDASEVTTLNNMFYLCYDLTEVDLSFLQCDKLASVDSMFNECYNLRKVKMPQGMHNVIAPASVFKECHKLVEVDMGNGPTSIGEKMFSKCISLERVTGLNNVTTIGDRAFIYTAALKDIDLDVSILTNIGESAFRLSCIEDCIQMDNLNANCTLGEYSTRATRWPTYGTLCALQDKSIPTVMLTVPYIGGQTRYPDITFGTNNEYNIANDGCSFFTLYLEWLYVNKKSFTRKMEFEEDFWNVYFKNAQIGEPTHQTVINVFNSNLASEKQWGYTYGRVADDATIFDTIIDRLNNKLPTYVSMLSANFINSGHAVLIVGGDTINRKLAILDPRISNGQTELVWVKFEDIFTSEIGNGIRIHTYPQS